MQSYQRIYEFSFTCLIEVMATVGEEIIRLTQWLAYNTVKSCKASPSKLTLANLGGVYHRVSLLPTSGVFP